MIRIGLLGYGNLSRGIEAAIKRNPDEELVAVFTVVKNLANRRFSVWRNVDQVKLLLSGQIQRFIY